LTGNFARIRPWVTGALFNGYLKFTQAIDLKEEGYFEITIYTFIYCPKEVCDSDDSFSIKIREIDSSNYRQIFKIGTMNGNNRDDRWREQKIIIFIFSRKLFVNIDLLDNNKK
jgi:hypothetical protein